jgi:hypothetical protein
MNIIDTHYAAYAASDLDGILTTLTADYTVTLLRPLRGHLPRKRGEEVAAPPAKRSGGAVAKRLRGSLQ